MHRVSVFHGTELLKENVQSRLAVEHESWAAKMFTNLNQVNTTLCQIDYFLGARERVLGEVLTLVRVTFSTSQASFLPSKKP